MELKITTLFRILTRLLSADFGRTVVAGFDVLDKYKFVQNVVGYIVEIYLFH